jgi:hypothetical protein
MEKYRQVKEKFSMCWRKKGEQVEKPFFYGFRTGHYIHVLFLTNYQLILQPGHMVAAQWITTTQQLLITITN